MLTERKEKGQDSQRDIIEESIIAMLRGQLREQGEVLPEKQEALARQAIRAWLNQQSTGIQEWSPWETIQAQAILAGEATLAKLASQLKDQPIVVINDDDEPLPVVYVANASAHSFDAASRFGEITILTDGYYGPKRMDRLLYELTKHLRNFDPQKDSFIPCGPDIVNFAAGYVLGMLQADHIRVMLWDGRKGNYAAGEIRSEAVKNTLSNLQKLVKSREEES